MCITVGNRIFNARLDLILSWGIMHLFFWGGSTGSTGALGKIRRDQRKKYFNLVILHIRLWRDCVMLLDWANLNRQMCDSYTCNLQSCKYIYFFFLEAAFKINTLNIWVVSIFLNLSIGNWLNHEKESQIYRAPKGHVDVKSMRWEDYIQLYFIAFAFSPKCLAFPWGNSCFANK